jgi:hypothetical protein
VYLGVAKGDVDWVGITKNFKARGIAHGALGRTITSEVDGAGYRQARALEHLLIEELRKRGYNLKNVQRGISPRSMHKYKDEHWTWARKKLREILDDLDSGG